jgi:hypothetical protein
MTSNITTLALNLLISERISHRNFLANKIISLIDGIGDVSSKQTETKEAFVALLHQCIANPTCQYRDLFYRYAEYYGKKIAGQENLSSAA